MKLWKLIKGLSVLLVGWLIPVQALVEPDGSKYKCTLKGIKHLSTSDVDCWKDCVADFIEWCKA